MTLLETSEGAATQRARQREERYRAMAVNIVYRILEPEPKR